MNESTPMISLGEALPLEIGRVQEIIRIYDEVPYGQIAAALMREDIRMAQQAMIEGDIVKMIAAYKALKETKL